MTPGPLTSLTHAMSAPSTTVFAFAFALALCFRVAQPAAQPTHARQASRRGTPRRRTSYSRPSCVGGRRRGAAAAGVETCIWTASSSVQVVAEHPWRDQANNLARHVKLRAVTAGARPLCRHKSPRIA